MRYKPKSAFTTPAMLLVPETVKSSGVSKKVYQDTGKIIFCSFKTYGGTEKDVNGVIAVEDTATVETWYRPDIKSDCAIKLQSGATYEIMGEPENIEMRNQFLKFKVRRIKGGA